MEEEAKELRNRFHEKLQRLTSGNTDASLASPYYDRDGVLNTFEQKIKESINVVNDQNRSFVGLVQATLSGKTRLIIEVSTRHPVILITFKNNNIAYRETLLKSLNEHNTKCETFEERRDHNRLIFIKLRLFLLAFLDFACLFKEYIMENKSWNDIDRNYKLAFSALLLNGGGKMVSQCLERRLDNLKRQQQQLKEIDLFLFNKSLEDELTILLERLERPWFAFDECHIPEDACKGLLFHSDYKKKLADGATVSCR